MSLWKKIGLGVVAALGVLFLVPGGWKLLLVLLAVTVFGVFLWWQWFQDSPPPNRDPAPPHGSRWDDRTERWR
ncbi:hypothetical protein ABZV14_41945 [Streptosporangium canum]|uniref:hypothetical protein n=1 Tax=Streptosporangium canum TaxID=324952 RepID=UPI0033AF2F76